MKADKQTQVSLQPVSSLHWILILFFSLNIFKEKKAQTHPSVRLEFLLNRHTQVQPNRSPLLQDEADHILAWDFL
jgi:hypothetical protein